MYEFLPRKLYRYWKDTLVLDIFRFTLDHNQQYNNQAATTTTTSTTTTTTDYRSDCFTNTIIDLSIQSSDHVLVDGNWGNWMVWEMCSVTCGGSTQSRTRECNRPAPAHGGDPCPESSVETRTCGADNCPPDEVTPNTGGRRRSNGWV